MTNVVCDNGLWQSEIQVNEGKRGLYFLHVNVRSLLLKLNEISMIARQTNAACIGIKESWLDNSVFDSELSIPIYTIVRRDRNRQDSGVCIFIRCDLAFNTRPDLQHDDLEAVWIELLLPKTKPILFAVVYRPSTQSNFYNF